MAGEPELEADLVVSTRERHVLRCPAAVGAALVDLGPLGVRTSSAQITDRYRPEELVGRPVVCVVNFPPKRIGPFVSEVLVTGAYSEGGHVVLLRPDHDVEPGSRIG